jgi:hypothetical protein
MNGKKAKKARKTNGAKRAESAKVLVSVIGQYLLESEVDAVFEVVLPNHEGSVYFATEPGCESTLEDSTVFARWSVGDTEILFCLPNEADEEFEALLAVEDAYRCWYRLSASDEGRWAVFCSHQAWELFEQMAEVYDIAGLTPPLSPRFQYPITAGEAIALITGQEVAR